MNRIEKVSKSSAKNGYKTRLKAKKSVKSTVYYYDWECGSVTGTLVKKKSLNLSPKLIRVHNI